MENFYKTHRKCLRKQGKKKILENIQENTQKAERKFIQGRGEFLESTKKFF